ncbi:DNA repair protein recA homolog 2, mitochondrial-like [Musa acuminata AAA Group]|uniref:DNA repair protein recA homolog 2, mitochondrial-like n=1 Tax=Musa acuminata AAA Group TaxID=214697 RepID=UPI0031E42F7F
MGGAFLSRAFSLLRAIRPALLPGQTSLRSRLPSLLQIGESNNGRFRIISCRLSSTVETLLEYEKDQPFDAEQVMDKESTLNLALHQLVGDFDRESNLSLSRFFCARSAPVISTGSLKLDLALGIGGLPKGRMVEIFGKEASGKTTLALHIIKEAQKLGGCCAYLDPENAMNPSLAETMGVNTNNLLISRVDCAEKTLSILNTLVRSGFVDVIVVDSVAALVPGCELDGVTDIFPRKVQSRLMTQALRKIHYSLCRSQTIIIFVNQVRANLRSNHGFREQDEVTCGGNALKFYAAVRMRIRRNCLLHSEDKVTGVTISVEVIKNKLAPAMKKANLNIRFGRGLCHEEEILEMAAKHGIIRKEENGYWIKGDFFKDHLAAEQFLAANNGVASDLVDVLRDQLLNKTS